MSNATFPSYTIFKPGAVLRHSDLNDTVKALEQMVLATNRLIGGSGVIHGLNVSCAIKDNITTLSISPGTALNANGHLLEFEEACVFKSIAAPGELPVGLDKCYSGIMELHPVGPKNLNNNISTSDNKCVFVLIEPVQTQVNTDSCFRQNEVNEKQSIRTRFFMGTPVLPNDHGADTCFATPCLPCFTGEELQNISDKESLTRFLQEKVQTAAKSLDDAFTLLKKCYPEVFCGEFGTLSKIFEDHNPTEISPFYAYNYLEILIAAYHELINLEFFQSCKTHAHFSCPEIVALGACAGECATDIPCRQYFKSNTPDCKNREEAVFYAKRLVALTNSENLDFTLPEKINLTPSRPDMAPLSRRAIPFYLKDKVLRPLWSHQATLQQTQNSIPPVDLACYMEGCDWIRTEGYIGKDVNDLKILLGADRQPLPTSLIHEEQSHANLPFQIRICALGSKNSFMETFTDYLKRHPGLKPCAGVPKGGTLLLLTQMSGAVGQNAPKFEVVADFCLPYYECCTKTETVEVLAEFELNKNKVLEDELLTFKGQNELEYKGELTQELIYELNHNDFNQIELSWINTSSPNADKFLWRAFKRVPVTNDNPDGVDVVDNFPVDTFDPYVFIIEASLLNKDEQTSFIIELNAEDDPSGASDQKNVLLDILPPPQQGGRPRLVSEEEQINALRTRHAKYRANLEELGEANADLKETKIFQNIRLFLDTANGETALAKTFTTLATQLISNINKEGGVPDEQYQKVLKNLIYFSFDKISFVQPDGLSTEEAKENLKKLFAKMKKEGTFSNLTTIKKGWKAAEISTEKNTAIIQQLNKLFDAK